MGRRKVKVDSSVLEGLAAAFAAHRGAAGDSTARIPDHLKKLAADAATQFGSQAAVAEAAGVTAKTISNWKSTQRSLVAPKELSLVRNVAPVAGTQMQEPSLIRIYFQTGIRMELLASSVNAQLVKVLNGGDANAVG